MKFAIIKIRLPIPIIDNQQFDYYGSQIKIVSNANVLSHACEP